MSTPLYLLALLTINQILCQVPVPEQIRMATPPVAEVPELYMRTPQCDSSTTNCSDLRSIATNCVDEPHPTFNLTCEQISSYNMCEIEDVGGGGYCKASCGKCGTCSVSMLGCKCMSKWVYGDKQVEFEGCANPDDDPQGDWCEVVTGSCPGDYNVKKLKYDYCAEECKTQYKIVPEDFNATVISNQTCEGQSCILPPKLGRKPRVVFSVISDRIYYMSNLEEFAVNMEGWQIFISSLKSPVKIFSESCGKTTIGALESWDFRYGSGDCYVGSVSVGYWRLVDAQERVIDNVDTSQIRGDTVYCLQDGEFGFVSTLECEWF